MPSFDIEMETGTGKTYVYIKTMYELNLKYGFSKFIIVVPSIAIREGIKKTFETTQDHFMQFYRKKIRHFIYDSTKLHDIEHFNNGNSINVMIINMQAFNSRTKDSRRIYEKIDIFNSRRPIDVIAATRPILIMDEPQKMGGKATQESLEFFNPLFLLNYSATHKVKNNLVYVLDALDAYNKKIVKKIEVKGVQIKNLRGVNGYLYLHEIQVGINKPPKAKIELEIAYNKSINRETRLLGVGDNLFEVSKEMEQYRNYVISEIDVYNGIVLFTNGVELQVGTAAGDVSEKDLRRIQIRETVKSHFEKEESLFNKRIKVLSLFFIDEVSKYRKYDEFGNELNSLYGEIFEDEYNRILNEYLENSKNKEYIEYLRGIEAFETHKGYFSIDKKTNTMIDPTRKGRSTESDDVSAYDLILKDKERLLSYYEPTRFIFSHSALREGWDNPNIFQICTLKYSDSDVQRHQEVGRGLRISVNENGERMDASILHNAVHDINKLTVIANESYEEFTSNLQKDIREKIYNRPLYANKDFFKGKQVVLNGEKHNISNNEATAIYRYLLKNDYVDDNDKITDLYKNDLENNKLAEIPEELMFLKDGIITLIESIFDEKVLEKMYENAQAPKVDYANVNDNFHKKEFQELWSRINKKYSYRVEFDTDELIENAVKRLDEDLHVTSLMYTVTTGDQDEYLDRIDISAKKLL